MKSGLLLLGLVCVLVGGGATWYFLKSAEPAAPAPSSAEVPAQPAAAPAETLSKEAPPPPSQPAPPPPTPAEVVKPKPAAPAIRMGEFLPYPNEGASDFEKKYGALDAETLAKALQALQERVNSEFNGLVEMQIAQGNFTERAFPPAPGAEAPPNEPPQGKGEARPSEQIVQQPDGTFRQRSTWVTQADQPEFFSHQAEYQWVANALKQKQKKP